MVELSISFGLTKSKGNEIGQRKKVLILDSFFLSCWEERKCRA